MNEEGREKKDFYEVVLHNFSNGAVSFIEDKMHSVAQVNTNFVDGGQPDIKAIGVGDLSAGCKFTATTYGMIIGIYRAVPQIDYSHVGIDRNLFKSDATDFPIPELDSIGMQTQFRCELSAPLIGLV